MKAWVSVFVRILSICLKQSSELQWGMGQIKLLTQMYQTSLLSCNATRNYEKSLQSVFTVVYQNGSV